MKNHERITANLGRVIFWHLDVRYKNFQNLQTTKSLPNSKLFQNLTILFSWSVCAKSFQASYSDSSLIYSLWNIQVQVHVIYTHLFINLKKKQKTFSNQSNFILLTAKFLHGDPEIKPHCIQRSIGCICITVYDCSLKHLLSPYMSPPGMWHSQKMLQLWMWIVFRRWCKNKQNQWNLCLSSSKK